MIFTRFAFMVLGVAAPGIAHAVLLNPFELDRSAPGPALVSGFKECGAVPAPVLSIAGTSYYVDALHSVVDLKLKEKNENDLKPIREFVKQVETYTEQYVVTQGHDPRPARCALGWLATWAGKAALLSPVNRQGGYEQDWSLASLALSYLRFKDEPMLDSGKRAQIEGWFRKLARSVQKRYSDPSRGDAHNNHAYWAGAAVAAGGLASGDPAAFSWGLQKFELFLEEVRPDGTLPRELKRGAKALHYHAFALEPLMVLAELGRVNGKKFYQEHDRALLRLAARVFEGWSDQNIFEKLAGIKQELLLPDELCALEAVSRREPEPRFEKWLLEHRPLRDRHLGGNQTLFFAARFKN